MANFLELGLTREKLGSLPNFGRLNTEHRNTTAQLIATKKTDAKIKAAILIVLAVIISGCGAYLIATSGGPTNALLLYGGIGLSATAVVLLLVVAVVAEKARRFKNEKEAELVDFLQQIQNNEVIYQAMTQEGIDSQNLLDVLRWMENGHYAQFVEYAAGKCFGDRNGDPVTENELKLLAALAREPKFISRDVYVTPERQVDILNNLQLEDAISVVHRVDGLRYNMIAYSPKIENQTCEVVVADRRFPDLLSPLQKKLLERVNQEKANEAVNRLSPEKYKGLATYVLSKGANEIVLNALASYPDTSKLSAIQLRELMKQVAQDKANAIVRGLNVEKYKEFFNIVKDGTDQVVLDALDSSVHTSELTHPELIKLIERVDQGRANVIVGRLSQEKYQDFAMDVLTAYYGNPTTAPPNQIVVNALASSPFNSKLKPDLQQVLMEHVDQETAYIITYHLDNEAFDKLAENVYTTYFSEAGELQPTQLVVIEALYNKPNRLSPEQNFAFLNAFDQETANAAIKLINREGYQLFLAHALQMPNNDKINIAIAQRPNDFGALVNVHQLSVDAIKKTYALMNEAQKAEFIKKVTDRFNAIEGQLEERIKIEDIVKKCIQQATNVEFEKDLLLTQFARWPEHSGKKIADNPELWEKRAMLDAYWKRMNEEQRASFVKGAGDCLELKNVQQRAQHWINMIDHYEADLPLFILKTMNATDHSTKIEHIGNIGTASERKTAVTQRHIKQHFQNKIANK